MPHRFCVIPTCVDYFQRCPSLNTFGLRQPSANELAEKKKKGFGKQVNLLNFLKFWNSIQSMSWCLLHVLSVILPCMWCMNPRKTHWYYNYSSRAYILSTLTFPFSDHLPLALAFSLVPSHLVVVIHYCPN